MIKRAMLIGAACLVILVAACIDSTTVISVRKDGSGTVTEILYFDESAKAMMQMMMSQFRDEEEEEEGVDWIDVEEYREKAEKLGAGVTFVSAEEVKREDGSSGVEVVYAFEDIEKLSIKPTPDNPMGDQMAGMMDAEPSEEEEHPIKFEFTRGRISTLVVHMPEEVEPDLSEEPEEAGEVDQTAVESGMGMMKSLLSGFRMRILIRPGEGKISKTNASFVERLDGKETVTLLDVALGEILSNDEYAKEWQDMSRVKDMATAMERMKKIPGLKIETEKRVEISFR